MNVLERARQNFERYEAENPFVAPAPLAPTLEPTTVKPGSSRRGLRLAPKNVGQLVLTTLLLSALHSAAPGARAQENPDGSQTAQANGETPMSPASASVAPEVAVYSGPPQKTAADIKQCGPTTQLLELCTPDAAPAPDSPIYRYVQPDGSIPIFVAQCDIESVASPTNPDVCAKPDGTTTPIMTFSSATTTQYSSILELPQGVSAIATTRPPFKLGESTAYLEGITGCRVSTTNGGSALSELPQDQPVYVMLTYDLSRNPGISGMRTYFNLSEHSNGQYIDTGFNFNLSGPMIGPRNEIFGDFRSNTRNKNRSGLNFVAAVREQGSNKPLCDVNFKF